MEERINLMKSHLDSMHDQVVNSVELIDNDLILHYESLKFSDVQNEEYYNNHCKFTRCDVIFRDVDVPYVEIKAKNKLKTKIRVYYIDELLILMKRKKMIIQTLYFYIGYNTVYIDAILISQKNEKNYNCYIVVPATEVLYKWK